ncbi:MAG TPA: hypothetical protein VJI12_00750 [archaeon]|nr:hypothetical protein [archaeon]
MRNAARCGRIAARLISTHVPDGLRTSTYGEGRTRTYNDTEAFLGALGEIGVVGRVADAYLRDGMNKRRDPRTGETVLINGRERKITYTGRQGV